VRRTALYLTNLLPQRLIDFFGTHRRRIAWTITVLAMLGMLGVFIYVGYGYEWTGFGESVRRKTATQDLRREKTLWDWLQLLIIPVFVAGATIWFNWRQQRRDQQSAEQRAQDDALQAYLDDMTELLTDEKRPLQKEWPGDSLSTVARARTLTVLEQLGVKKDVYRKRSVLQFLYEADLINKSSPVISLRQASLKDANFRDLKLPCAHLSETYLPGADLSAANLSHANLVGADLSHGASLYGADLRGANLRDADLRGAILEMPRGPPRSN
jgi:hypothetical protein